MSLYVWQLKVGKAYVCRLTLCWRAQDQVCGGSGSDPSLTKSSLAPSSRSFGNKAVPSRVKSGETQSGVNGESAMSHHDHDNDERGVSRRKVEDAKLRSVLGIASINFKRRDQRLAIIDTPLAG
jgi:hypothetical protein